jgi:hypothetical protein
MRKLATWVVVTLGIAALLHRLKRRRAASAEPDAPPAPAADPADELRRKLAESRTASAAPEAVPEATVSERRADVHDEARTALDEMRSRAEP